jgi:hypothetical protein
LTLLMKSNQKSFTALLLPNMKANEWKESTKDGGNQPS